MREAYELAFRKAGAALARSNLDAVCVRTGAVRNGRILSVSFFGRRVDIRVPDPRGPEESDVPPPELSPSDLPLVERILILHYLTGPGRPGAALPGGGEAPASDRLVSFKNLPGAAFYADPYRKRGPGRIARRFGASAEEFERACSALGWGREHLGDRACSFEVFPRIRGVVVLHLGDEEFPAEAAILHNEGIADFLPLEDVAVLGGSIATRLTRAL
jgi:hypothetical protein